MKYAVVATLFALAAAQTREDIPSCATPCLDDAVKSGTSCSITDYACICPHVTELSGSATGCVIKACGADVAVAKVLPAVQALCAAQGTAGASTGSSASATSTAPSSGSGSSSSSSSSSASATSATPSVTSSVPVTTSWTSIPCDTTLVSQTPTNNQTMSTTVPIAGAAGLSVGAAAVVLAVLAL
ncbi:Extracellular membrane protein, 8-cysteine region, CFEM [Beauveria brongniartii RCEF 3172]|uniref:Extracellular membrane protein, 8-cysteine region, CFEM n=1 Tax=Beauveria brongniartii RCEF 3172 TaxID=1081107 RepID=A0A166XTH4_9HYPO|nr:Extracellular membrane protein, 8-cysteine region, CFEM [Beauveria brongniartii RCEF 3172]